MLQDLRDPEVQLDPTANRDNLDPLAQQEGREAQVRPDLRAQDYLVLPALADLLDPQAQRVQLDLLVHLALQATLGHKVALWKKFSSEFVNQLTLWYFFLC